MKKMALIVAVTGCPTGIAHTMIAPEALKKTAPVMGHNIAVETQGAEGVKDAIRVEDIDAADVVIVSSDIYIDMSRFAAKPIYGASTTEAICYTKAVITAALKEAAAASKVIDYVEEPLVPIDLKGNPASSSVDAEFCQAIGGNMVKVVTWYDNEWGYACRTAGLAGLMAGKL